MHGYFRKKGTGKKKRTPGFAPFRSGLEKRVSQQIEGYDYEPKGSQVAYSMPHKYTPDFIPQSNPRVILEVKGYFRTSAEAAKYVAVKRDNPSRELIFLFSNPIKKAHPGCKRRVDGTVMTLANWCERHGFLYYHEKTMPKAITSGNVTDAWITSERKRMGYHVDTT